MGYNFKDFSIQKEIKKRVNKEAEIIWAMNTETPPIPKFQKAKILKNNIGWLNLIISSVYSLRP